VSAEQLASVKEFAAAGWHNFLGSGLWDARAFAKYEVLSLQVAEGRDGLHRLYLLKLAENKYFLTGFYHILPTDLKSLMKTWCKIIAERAAKGKTDIYVRHKTDDLGVGVVLFDLTLLATELKPSTSEKLFTFHIKDDSNTDSSRAFKY
jgi:hypothetical protein